MYIVSRKILPRYVNASTSVRMYCTVTLKRYENVMTPCFDCLGILPSCVITFILQSLILIICTYIHYQTPRPLAILGLQFLRYYLEISETVKQCFVEALTSQFWTCLIFAINWSLDGTSICTECLAFTMGWPSMHCPSETTTVRTRVTRWFLQKNGPKGCPTDFLAKRYR
jgi:hypothetical protein